MSYRTLISAASVGLALAWFGVLAVVVVDAVVGLWVAGRIFGL